jgi:hypothetical protein
MTDTAVAPENTEVKPDEQPKKVIIPEEKLSVLAQALLGEAKKKAAELKSVAEKQNKVGDVGKLLSEAIESSEDAKVKEMRVKREKAAAAVLQLDKAMEELVKPTLSIPTDEELAAMDKQYKELSSQLNTFNTVFGTEMKDQPEVSLFDYIGEIPKGRKGAKAGQGEGTKRPRVKSIEVTQDQKGEEDYVRLGTDEKSTFTHLAQKIKKDTGEDHSASDFHAEWTKQNNVKDWTDINEVSKFTYSVTDAAGKTHTYWVRVTR